MALPTLSVINSTNSTVTINTLPNSGQANSGNSIPVVIASDQSNLTVLLSNTGIPNTTGQKAAALSLPVTLDSNLETGPGIVGTAAITVQGNANSLPIPIYDAYLAPTTANWTTIVSSAPDTSLVTVGLDPAQSLPAGNNIIGTVNQKDAQLVPLGCYQVFANSTSCNLATLIATTLPAARLVYVEPETGDIRWRDDGTAPTASVGSRIYQGTDYPINTTLSAVQLISVTGANTTVNLRFYS